jgi:hypothetical protein
VEGDRDRERALGAKVVEETELALQYGPKVGEVREVCLFSRPQLQRRFDLATVSKQGEGMGLVWPTVLKCVRGDHRINLVAVFPRPSAHDSETDDWVEEALGQTCASGAHLGIETRWRVPQVPSA